MNKYKLTGHIQNEEIKKVIHESSYWELIEEIPNQEKLSVIDTEYLNKYSPEEFKETFHLPSTFIISSLSDEENIDLIKKYTIHHLVGFNPERCCDEINDNIYKIQNKKYWGLDLYLEDDSTIKIHNLSDSKFTHQMVKETLDHLDFSEYFSSPIEYLKVIADELISNSLYKGPSKKRSEQGHADQDRKSPAFLKGAELVQVTFGMDSQCVGLSVQDSFGSLSFETLVNSLERSFREKTVMDKKDGAGLGLYMAFLHGSQFIVNLRPHFRTEVISIIEKNKRYKTYKQRVRSFHFYEEVVK
jgi:sigma-B regulation protein RsbU (phosphoserine phosphatase)